MLSIFSFFCLSQLFFCPEKKEDHPIVIEGLTMGTTYRIVYFDNPRQRNFKYSIDSLLRMINQSINTYDSNSEISRFNRSIKGITLQLPFLAECLKKSQEIYDASKGAFDPTVMPLVSAWGFGPGKSLTLSKDKVDSLKALVGFYKISFNDSGIWKTDPRLQLDMGGIGQGFGADVLFRFLKQKGIENLLVELGGEGIAGGKNLQKNKQWQIGILNPNSSPENQYLKAYVILQNKSFTTSGNYFNYRVVDGKKLSHTIDPVTGYPVEHKLLSVSLFSDDCTTADAWATAFMVMGLKKTVAQLKQMQHMDALLIYSARKGKMKTYITRGIKKFITLEK